MFCWNRTVHKVLWGLFWIALGSWILLSNYGLTACQFSFHRDWPVVLIAVGVIMLVRSFARRGHGWHGWRARHGTACCGGPDTDKQSREQILKAVEDGAMSADEAAAKLKGL
jgi:hypothetical protein